MNRNSTRLAQKLLCLLKRPPKSKKYRAERPPFFVWGRLGDMLGGRRSLGRFVALWSEDQLTNPRAALKGGRSGVRGKYKRLLSKKKNYFWLYTFVETISRELFESIGPPFRELSAINFYTFWDQREKAKTVLPLQSEPS